MTLAGNGGAFDGSSWAVPCDEGSQQGSSSAVAIALSCPSEPTLLIICGECGP